MSFKQALQFTNNYQLLKSSRFDHSQINLSNTSKPNKNKVRFQKSSQSQISATPSLEQMLNRLVQFQQSQYEINKQWSHLDKSPPQKSLSRSKVNVKNQSTSTVRNLSPTKTFQIGIKTQPLDNMQYIEAASKKNKYFKEIYEYQSRK